MEKKDSIPLAMSWVLGFFFGALITGLSMFLLYKPLPPHMVRLSVGNGLVHTYASWQNTTYIMIPLLAEIPGDIINIIGLEAKVRKIKE